MGNFARIFNDDETTIIALDEMHWSGGRVYIEYQLWQNEQRIAVERRFYDIDHWKMPLSEKEMNSSQTWRIVIATVSCIAAMVYCVFRCNKWCKTLEHEKMD